MKREFESAPAPKPIAGATMPEFDEALRRAKLINEMYPSDVRQAFWWEQTARLMAAALAAPAPDAVPSDVADLVIAARIVAYEDHGQEALRNLDRAVEVFSERVPWDDEEEIDREEDRVRAALNAEGK